MMLDLNYDAYQILIQEQLVKAKSKDCLNLRITCSKFKRTVDAHMYKAVESMLKRMVPCRNPALCTQALCNISEGVGWFRGYTFLRTICLMSNHALVAGSVALYIERLSLANTEADLPNWWPRNVSAWGEDTTAGWITIDALENDGRDCRHQKVQGVVSEQFYALRELRSIEFDFFNVRIMSQLNRSKLPDWISESLEDEDIKAMKETHIRRQQCCGHVNSSVEMCYGCLRSEKTEDPWGLALNGYIRGWMVDYPHKSFAVDVECVALRKTPKGPTLFTIERVDGCALGKTITVRPQGMWRILDDSLMCRRLNDDNAELESIIRSNMKHGYTDLKWADVYYHVRENRRFEHRITETTREMLEKLASTEFTLDCSI